MNGLRWMILATSATIFPSLAQGDEYWRLSASGAECIKAHISQYKGMNEFPLIVHVYDCPNNDPLIARRNLQQNSILPNPKFNELSEDIVIVLSRQDLDCLDPDDFVELDEFVLLPKAVPCQ